MNKKIGIGVNKRKKTLKRKIKERKPKKKPIFGHLSSIKLNKK